MITTHSDSGGPFALASAAAEALRDRLGVDEHDVVVILGSGWAAAADGLGKVVADVELSGLPGFPEPRVPGHRDLARSVRVGDHKVLVLAGRVHLYEGFTASQIVHGVRTASAAGCTQAILTNAAGAIKSNFAVGRPVLLSDQLNLTGTSPMAGPPPPEPLPGRFCDMTNAFSPRLRSIAQTVDPTLDVGVYAGMYGGAYETPAEVRMLAGLGADLVGMSTVLETIAARHLDMEVLGISLVTNMAAGITGQALAHTDVLDTAAHATGTIVPLIRHTIERL
jgi:purine-nucleoside phosphorylase